MVLPSRAKVEAAPNFLANLDAAQRFFQLQDADSAEARLARLKAALREMVELLAWSPAAGRPARFIASRSAQGRLKLAAVRTLAAQAGLPELREYIIGQHVVLYAHSDEAVVLLALKHQRQLAYLADA